MDWQGEDQLRLEIPTCATEQRTAVCADTVEMEENIIKKTLLSHLRHQEAKSNGSKKLSDVPLIEG